ncbi:class I SAM-dependent methyltransferase [uncultured Pseudoteredinibacter sp.]|uniref:class I SAM-dependent methyltransferase n=1 Tax=uncultured Pseudoteredinibacter sp. TaxID=1641701 RepID=UPI0026202468|nr:class I SAM-dependent methyltransferase [uncultured Pseudoteredinibacter sp.]
MKREQQENYSMIASEMFNQEGRTQKAKTMWSVLSDCIEEDCKKLRLLNVGGSSGIIDEYLAGYFSSITSLDIDVNAQFGARKIAVSKNVHFVTSDATGMGIKTASVDVVICSQVYEHVLSPELMMAEINRVLKPGGICYFSASNRLMFNEPHYNLKFLSLLPRFLAHKYVRAMGKGDFYHEKHYSYWALKHLVKKFEVVDYTQKIVNDPVRFQADYMLPSLGLKHFFYKLFCRCFYFLMPGYIWVLRKSSH